MGVGEPVNRVSGRLRVSELRRPPGPAPCSGCAWRCCCRCCGARPHGCAPALRPRGARRRAVLAPLHGPCGSSESAPCAGECPGSCPVVGAVRPRLLARASGSRSCSPAALAIDAGLWLFDSTVQWYVGSSGVLHGILAAGTLAQLRRRQPEGWLLAADPRRQAPVRALRRPPCPSPAAGRSSSTAHVFGVLGGAAAALALRPRPLPL